MPIEKLVSLALMILTSICVTHPMGAALAIRKVELSILREASDTRSWGVPVVFTDGKKTKPRRLNKTAARSILSRPDQKSSPASDFALTDKQYCEVSHL